ncbi:hypothetical protein CSC80_04330 [Maribacter sp. 6B07]|uniref:acyltransferase family protein n=1 Tax=Maribacter sp. 6B07 TaxID=2045442 RepID=UPI000C08CE81|nr:acyltransferase [Maribacter sp. 6B07]PHN94580.1 hypothetical protein CSC80_04330 [Maribacter sp. 6B07]
MYNTRNYTLDFIRGVSALIVMSGHLRIALYKDFSELGNVENSSLVEKGFYFITGLGHEAVMVFFVLSGYFVGGSVIKNQKYFSSKNYLIARLSRLWVPLLPILIFTIIIDYFIGIASPELLNGNYYSILNSGPKTDYSISFLTFLSNMSFLQTIFTPVYGTNGPLWSLAYEFWYYILFPILMILSNFIKRNILSKIIGGILAIFIVRFMPLEMLQGFLIWLFGAAVYLITTKKYIQTNVIFILSSFSLFIFSLLNSKFEFSKDLINNYNDIFTGISFSFFLISIINYQIPNFKFLNLKKFSFWISEISYTLYITHFPIVLLIYSNYYLGKQLTFNFNSNLQFTAWFLLLIFISILFWYLFERNTPIIRKKVKGLISK